ncbi:MAG: hypothetical protein HY051_05525, partial [Candidatus Aenigmarchaeota archaeon]|nr:hypothetical protein [Candidatus Aenigmarchaeota archaeon]
EVGLSATYLCHRSAVDGNWKWETQAVVQAEVESDISVSGICSDNYDNNCNGYIDSADANDCKAPVSVLDSVEGDSAAPFFDTINDGTTTVKLAVNDFPVDTSEVRCKWYVLESGYDADTGVNCANPDVSNFVFCTFDPLGDSEGSHTGYVACIDENLNGQPYTDGVSSRTSKKIDWTGDWTGPAASFANPPDPTGVPYDIEIGLSDAFAGVDKSTVKIFVSNNGGADTDITSSVSVSGNCQNAGVNCAYKRTIIKGGAEAADGTHKLTVTSKDNLGNSQQAPNTYTYIVSTCNLDSASIAPSAACNKALNMCSAAGAACAGGNAIDVTAGYTGLNCPTSFTVQVDAKSADNLCNVQGSGGQMAGISITCSNPTPKSTQQTCTGTWNLPNPVPPACQGKAITAKSGVCDASIDGVYCATPTGSFGACYDTTVPITSITVNSGSDFSSSRTITATSLSGKDNTYGLNSCILGWADAVTTTKTCGGSVGEECASLFSAAEKQHTYGTDSASVADKISTFSCTNKNTVTGSTSDSITVCSSIADASNLLAYDSASKTTTLSASAWQRDSTPYFEWTAVTSLCGVTYDVQVDSNPATTITTNSYAPVGSLSDAKHTFTVTSKDGNNLRLAGTAQTFNLWVDTAAPTTSIDETIPAWFTTEPNLHLSCSDSPAGENSGCGTTRYCTGSGCAPGTNYNPATGITISSSTVLGYSSSDNAGNNEITSYTTINVDTTPPSAVTVSDSGAFTASTTTLTATWTTSEDAQSGISLYQYAVGTTSGGTDIRGFTDVGLATSATITGLALLNENTYYITVRSKNGAGLFSTPASTDGITVDTEGPTGVNAVTVENSFGSYSSSPFAAFTGSIADALSGVNRGTCGYTIDDSVWGAAIWNATDSSCKESDIACTDGQSLTVKMRVSDNLDTYSATSPAISKICDATTPVIESIIPGTGETRRTSSKDVGFSVTAKDAKSGMSAIEWILFVNDVDKGSLFKKCDGGTGVSVTCTFQSGLTEMTSCASQSSPETCSFAPKSGKSYWLSVEAQTGSGTGTISLEMASPGDTVETTDTAVVTPAPTGFTCADATDLGSISPGGTISQSTNNLDASSLVNKQLFKFTTNADTALTLTLTSPDGADFDAKIYYGDCPNVKNGDKIRVDILAGDHVDTWSDVASSGEWIIDFDIPGVSDISPTVATFNVQTNYSAVAKSQTGKTIVSCDLLVNGVKVDDMVLTAGTAEDGTWTGRYTITSPAIIFMRAQCTDSAGNKGDGLDVLVSLATDLKSGVNLLIDKPPVFSQPLFKSLPPVRIIKSLSTRVITEIKSLPPVSRDIPHALMLPITRTHSKITNQSSKNISSQLLPISQILKSLPPVSENISSQLLPISEIKSLPPESVIIVNLEKGDITNITAYYKLLGEAPEREAIKGAKCWISASNFNDPAKGIVGANLKGLDNGYYTYSFEAPTISGLYGYTVSCAKRGYQTSSNSGSFFVLGCEGVVCIKVTPKDTAAILTLGKTQTISLQLKNRADDTRKYSISLISSDPKVLTEISPTQITLANGEIKTVKVLLTSLVLDERQIIQNIKVENIATNADFEVSSIRIAIAISTLPEIGAVEVVAIFALAALIVYLKSKNKKHAKKSGKRRR